MSAPNFQKTFKTFKKSLGGLSKYQIPNSFFNVRDCMCARLCGWGVFKCHCVCNMRGVSVDERQERVSQKEYVGYKEKQFKNGPKLRYLKIKY